MKRVLFALVLMGLAAQASPIITANLADATLVSLGVYTVDGLVLRGGSVGTEGWDLISAFGTASGEDFLTAPTSADFQVGELDYGAQPFTLESVTGVAAGGGCGPATTYFVQDYYGPHFGLTTGTDTLGGLFGLHQITIHQHLACDYSDSATFGDYLVASVTFIPSSQFDPNAITPEPASWLLLLTGLLAVAALKLRASIRTEV